MGFFNFLRKINALSTWIAGKANFDAGLFRAGLGVDVKAVCKLGFLAALGLLHGVPEGGAVTILGGGWGGRRMSVQTTPPLWV